MFRSRLVPLILLVPKLAPQALNAFHPLRFSACSEFVHPTGFGVLWCRWARASMNRPSGLTSFFTSPPSRDHSSNMLTIPQSTHQWLFFDCLLPESAMCLVELLLTHPTWSSIEAFVLMRYGSTLFSKAEKLIQAQATAASEPRTKLGDMSHFRA